MAFSRFKPSRINTPPTPWRWYSRTTARGSQNMNHARFIRAPETGAGKQDMAHRLAGMKRKQGNTGFRRRVSQQLFSQPGFLVVAKSIAMNLPDAFNMRRSGFNNMEIAWGHTQRKHPSHNNAASQLALNSPGNTPSSKQMFLLLFQYVVIPASHEGTALILACRTKKC